MESLSGESFKEAYTRSAIVGKRIDVYTGIGLDARE